MVARRLRIDEVTARLGVKRETVYAYVSRGLLRSQLAEDGRSSTFDPAEVDAVATRGRPRRRPRQGEGIDAALGSAVTELGDGLISYHGIGLEELAGARPFEAVAELLWSGALPDPPTPAWSAPLAGVATARRALTAIGPHCAPGDRLRVAVAAAATVDPLRHDLRPEAVLHCGRSLIATVSEALAPQHGPTRSAAERSVAQRVAEAVGAPSSARWHGVIDVALVCLADHELATSTLAARVAASTRADPTAVVLAGLATLSGPLHGSASVAVQRFLADAAEDAPAAVATLLRTDGQLPGFGHPVHRHGDPRHALVLDAVRTAAAANARTRARLAEVDAVLAVTAQRAPVPPNVDFALGALGHVAGLPLGATELLMAVARTAGWIAHAIEEYAEPPLRFRARARGRAADPAPTASPSV